MYYPHNYYYDQDISSIRIYKNAWYNTYIYIQPGINIDTEQ